jgi:RNA polymerase sigma factor (sigma-70 family)
VQDAAKSGIFWGDMTPVLARRLNSDRSFERLYQKYAGDVYRYALVVLRNEADAEDVTQTTFMNAYRAMERGERPRQPQNWLITIAHNVCRQRFRQSQRRPNEVVYEEELAEAVVDEDAISAEDIRRALGHLAFNQRSALVMRELEGRSYQEIAEILGVSVSAVETLIFRARRALREQLEEGITCHEAELAISKQLDKRLSRKQKGALRAHLRECDDCAGFARSQRAQRGALKALGAIPLPQSLVGLFGGGGAATVGGGVAVKAAAIAAGAALATGVGYEGVKHGIAHPTRPSATPFVVKKQPTRTPAAAAPVVVVARSQEARHDQKPFRKSAVKARRAAVKRHGKPAVGRPASARPAQAQAVSAPSSHAHAQKPKGVKPAHPTHPSTPAATHSHGQNAGGQGKRSNPPKKKETPPPAKGKGKGGGGGAGDGTTGAPGKGGGSGNGNNASR